MAITFVEKHEAFTDAATSLTLNVPSGAAADDLLIAIITTAGTKTTSSANDFSWGKGLWTQVHASNVYDAYIFWRVMESGDTSWTFTSTSSIRQYGCIVAYTESGTPNWCVMGTYSEDDTSLSTATGRVDVESGIGLSASWGDRSTGGITGITHDIGTSRVSGVNAAGSRALAVYEHAASTHATFTSTATGTTPADHFATGMALYTLPTAVYYDPADLLDAVHTKTGYIYKGRDTASNDTAGVV